MFFWLTQEKERQENNLHFLLRPVAHQGDIFNLNYMYILEEYWRYLSNFCCYKKHPEHLKNVPRLASHASRDPSEAWQDHEGFLAIDQGGLYPSIPDAPPGLEELPDSICHHIKL